VVSPEVPWKLVREHGTKWEAHTERHDPTGNSNSGTLKENPLLKSEE
jgi:hypothetical protein